MDQPRILVISPDLPYPIRAGGQMRIASMVEALSRCAVVRVACIAPALPEATVSWCARLGVDIASIVRAPRSLLSRIRTKLRVVLMRDNLICYPEEQGFFDREIEAFEPDLIWLETPYQIKYVLKHKRMRPVLVDYWGLSEGSRREYLFASGWARVRAWLYWRAAAHAEAKYAREFDYLASVSTLLSRQLASYAPASRIWAIPNGIVKAVPPGVVRPEQDVMVMTGDFSFGPNRDAATYFVDRIFPLIRASVPEATVRLVGRDPAPDVAALGQVAGVTVTGFVEDMMAEIARGSLYILPLRTGSGIRSKLFDVFPLGRPIVLTSIGAEGLEFETGENCVIADAPEAFASACAALLRNEAECLRLGQNATRLATEVYTQASVDRMVADCVAEVTGDAVLRRR